MLASARDQLSRWGISEHDAARAGLFDVEDASTVNPDFKPYAGLILPYYATDGSMMTYGNGVPFCRVRYLDAPEPKGFKAQKPMRYGQPQGSGLHAYFAPVDDWQRIQNDAGEPCLITEGEAKGLAATLAGFPTIALGGVFNYGTNDELLPELEAFDWRGRDTYVVYDSDALTNPNVLAAEARLVDELQRKRGAKCFLVRLPQDGDSKIGVDDYLLAHGANGLLSLLQSAPSLGGLDAKVVALNRQIAWIERENLVYDMEMKLWLQKDALTNGSRFSALEHITVGGKQRTEPKRISVAATWLKHPHAQRFSEVLFRPGEGVTISGENGRPALNLWQGWEPAEGDVTPWLELYDHLFGNMKENQRDLSLNLLAYKAQNPQEKIPLAIVLIGTQGCGKTLWSDCVRDAFSPYGTTISSRSFYGEFQGWLERSLIGTMNEVEPQDLQKGGEVLKALISDLQRPMNEKYRPARQINSYTFYILTSNKRAVGAFSADDRRMIVVDCPPKKDHEFYLRVVRWREAGGCKALLGYLLNYDLKGWRPPAAAPMTAEKYMAYVESLTTTQRLAEEMRTASEHNIKLWLDQAVAWARVAELGTNAVAAAMARATIDGVQHYQIRPWYTPEELALMFPSIVEQTLGSKFDRTTPSGRISRELREAGVPYLTNIDDPRGFHWKGVIRQYLVVSDFDEWSQPIRQADFERLMKAWPTYGQMTKGKK